MYNWINVDILGCIWEWIALREKATYAIIYAILRHIKIHLHWCSDILLLAEELIESILQHEVGITSEQIWNVEYFHDNSSFDIQTRHIFYPYYQKILMREKLQTLLVSIIEVVILTLETIRELQHGLQKTEWLLEAIGEMISLIL